MLDNRMINCQIFGKLGPSPSWICRLSDGMCVCQKATSYPRSLIPYTRQFFKVCRLVTFHQWKKQTPFFACRTYLLRVFGTDLWILKLMWPIENVYCRGFWLDVVLSVFWQWQILSFVLLACYCRFVRVVIVTSWADSVENWSNWWSKPYYPD